MTMKLIFSAILSVGLVTSASAAMSITPIADSDPGFVRVAEGCGPAGWRGPYGHCHYGPGWGWRWGRACPPGMHLGPYGHRCWPN
jgi:hypothetical protein